MKTALLFLAGLTLLAALAEGIILHQVRMDAAGAGRLAAAVESLALVLGVFVALTNRAFIRQLREWALQSPIIAVAMPLVLLVPYFIFVFGTGTFAWTRVGKLAVYVVSPTLLLLPDRLHRAVRAGWRDYAAMLALGLPVSAGWLGGLWVWPQELGFFRPLYSVSAGVYAFVVIRDLEGVGYRLTLRKGDWIDGSSNFAGFALLGIPLGLALGFIHFQPRGLGIGTFLMQLIEIYLTIAIPEELLFRGILQNFLSKSLSHPRRNLYALLIASVIFGASHLHHPPIPNWKYGVMATLAGLFYGNAFRNRQRLPASALTHALVDTCWHFWF